MRTRQIFIIAAAFGFLAVALGAFGAHAFKSYLITYGRLDTFEVAVRYQFYHAIALFVVGLLNQNENHKKSLQYSALSMSIGIVLFSGSLYMLCLTSSRIWAIATPVGGLFFLIGWGLLFLFAIKKAG